MHGDLLLDRDGLKGLEDRLGSVLNQRASLTALRDQIVGDLEEKEREVVRLGEEAEVLTLVLELYKVLLDMFVEEQVRSVERLGSHGLQTVFFDTGLSLEADVEPKYNKISVEFFLRKGSKDDPLSHRGRPLDSFGGGPSSFVSLILRILAVQKLKLWPLLVLDESLAAVSDDYISATGMFIRALAEKMGFDVILVTHKPAFIEHAHVAYRCTEETEPDGVSTHVVVKKVA